jgi:hypothetical protein
MAESRSGGKFYWTFSLGTSCPLMCSSSIKLLKHWSRTLKRTCAPVWLSHLNCIQQENKFELTRWYRPTLISSLTAGSSSVWPLVSSPCQLSFLQSLQIPSSPNWTLHRSHGTLVQGAIYPKIHRSRGAIAPGSNLSQIQYTGGRKRWRERGSPPACLSVAEDVVHL